MDLYHCELAWLGGDAAEPDVLVAVEGDRITSVEAGRPPPPGAERLRGLTLPGIANAHSHAFHRALRARTQRGGSFWTWRDQMYGVAASLDPEGYHRLARATFAEMALAGITCVGEFHYLHHGPAGQPYADLNAMSAALVAAATEAGVRLTLLDTCYLRGGFGRELDDLQRRFADADAEAWSDRADAATALTSSTVQVAAAAHSVRAVDPASLALVAAWAVDRDLPLHVHVSEQPAENDDCLAATGRTPTQLLADQGVLDARFTAVHATHVDAADVARLGAAGATACFCPTTERDLADGIGPVAGLLAAGAALAIGSDSHAVIDPFEEVRAVELHERLASGRRGVITTADLLRAATAGGHRSLGWDDGGALAPGMLADMVTVRLDTVRTAGAGRDHALEAVVFAATAADVERVLVGGRTIVEDGRHRDLDVARELTVALS